MTATLNFYMIFFFSTQHNQYFYISLSFAKDLITRSIKLVKTNTILVRGRTMPFINRYNIIVSYCSKNEVGSVRHHIVSLLTILIYIFHKQFSVECGWKILVNDILYH